MFIRALGTRLAIAAFIALLLVPVLPRANRDVLQYVSRDWIQHNCHIELGPDRADESDKIVYSLSLSDRKFHFSTITPLGGIDSDYRSDKDLIKLLKGKKPTPGDLVPCYLSSADISKPIFAKLTPSKLPLFSAGYFLTVLAILGIFLALTLSIQNWYFPLVMPELMLQESADSNRRRLFQWIWSKKLNSKNNSEVVSTRELARRSAKPILTIAIAVLSLVGLALLPTEQWISPFLILLCGSSVWFSAHKNQFSILCHTHADFSIKGVPSSLKVGEKYPVSWSAVLNQRKVSRIRVQIICKEQVLKGKQLFKKLDYQVCSETLKKGGKEKLIYTHELGSQDVHSNRHTGSAILEIPENMPHCLSTPHCRVIWTVKVEIERKEVEPTVYHLFINVIP